jgi:hypothetical protein
VQLNAVRQACRFVVCGGRVPAPRMPSLPVCCCCCCCRLKAELQGLSRAPLQAGGSVAGSSPFDVKLLALTARLSRWAQQERSAGEVRACLLTLCMFMQQTPGMSRHRALRVVAVIQRLAHALHY